MNHHWTLINTHTTHNYVAIKATLLEPQPKVADGNHVLTISSQELLEEDREKLPYMAIEIPQEAVRRCGGSEGETVRAVAFLIHNVSQLFPSGLPGKENE